MKAYRLEIETEGFIRFASREVGRLVDTGDFISNTSLYYALGLVNSPYIDTLKKPTYIKDTNDIHRKIYVAPAVPINDLKHTNLLTTVSGNNYITLNLPASDSRNVINKKNYPKLGSERVLTPQNRFETFLIVREPDYSFDLPRYFRLGKKRGKAKVHLEEIDVIEKTGVFNLNHPIGVYDTDMVPSANLITKKIRPVPLMLQARYEGKYLELNTDKVKKIPGDIGFLKQKR
ncbi:type I-D CRISPR-associated protein Cas5/Csc1 [Methanonatronarchaeum sp. AMET-Sl]|uniref:type I-D CRISPR-associated protein Cas5/Csc1 n=1 Tax=Methanonatronarchaeum sp. AMET-Sl TaxID=3037654 RepID=UPI00244DE05A|nr:type I-D CRISPR-associated protein Cas5/Csc1 [Methanonatronarchaeum sp. AMET-Sl]WGI17877.1 type I-D CRISPR-associated protein Cas5/Csc1 [Methanonatronarchaeum sp. AMET-Sl]